MRFRARYSTPASRPHKTSRIPFRSHGSRTPGTYNYSTHGFTIAAAALEIKAKATFASLIQTRIAAPLGLDTLRAEIRTSPDSSGERATINAGVVKVSSAQFENVSWKAGGSGIESSALDLALFGDGVLRNRYFPQTTRNAMWSGGTSGGQANGWTINTKVTQVDKTGSNQGSDAHIRIDVVNGITVVALTNIDDPSADTTALTQQLLDIAQANP
jgi:CubicO group peptidase (beta-lactamase class C family)